MKIEITPEQEEHVVRKSLIDLYDSISFDPSYYNVKLSGAVWSVIKHYSTPKQWEKFCNGGPCERS